MTQEQITTATKIWQIIGTLAIGGFGGLVVPLIKDWLKIRRLRFDYVDKGYSGKHLVKVINDNDLTASVYNISLQFWSDGKLRYEQPWDEFKDSGDRVYYISCANQIGEGSLIRHVFYIANHNVYPISVELDSGRILGLIFQVSGKRGYEMRLTFESNIRNGMFCFRNRRKYCINLPTKVQEHQQKK